jgi:hypothetical protein
LLFGDRGGTAAVSVVLAGLVIFEIVSAHAARIALERAKRNTRPGESI